MSSYPPGGLVLNWRKDNAGRDSSFRFAALRMTHIWRTGMSALLKKFQLIHLLSCCCADLFTGNS
jgi:hypothetical protein